jgi:hypothetical protein
MAELPKDIFPTVSSVFLFWVLVMSEKLFSYRNREDVMNWKMSSRVFLVVTYLVLLGALSVLLVSCGGGGGGSDGGGEEDNPEYAFGLSFFQYRVFENSSVGYLAFLPMTKDGEAIQEEDIDDIRIYTSASTVLNGINEGFSTESYMYLNCMVEPCAQSGPLKENGFWRTFAFLPEDIYSVEVDTADGQALNLDAPYPGQLVLPIVLSSTMQSSWDGNDLILNWTNPIGATNWADVDQLRIKLFDGTGKSVMYIRLYPTADTVTINGNLLNQAAGLGDGTLGSWEVQTRAYDENNMNFARGYSNKGILAPHPSTCIGEVIDPISLTIGAILNQTIEAFGTKFYVFEVVDPATYTISLYNMTTDNDWVLINYISNCEDDYPLDPPIIAESDNILTDPDIMDVSLNTGKYLLIVDEYDNQPSSYTVSVTR